MEDCWALVGLQPALAITGALLLGSWLVSLCTTFLLPCLWAGGMGPRPASPAMGKGVRRVLHKYLAHPPPRDLDTDGSASAATPPHPWALVTGAGDGIGREFALALGQAGVPLLLLGRQAEKLERTAQAIREARGSNGSSPLDVRCLPFDLATTDPERWQVLRQLLAPLSIRILIHNAAMNHAMPTPFVEEDADLLGAIVQVNVAAVVALTRICLPGMVAARRGLVLNVGSMAGAIPSPLLATYSGSKAFLATWSTALAHEVAPHGVDVEHLNTYFVVSPMSRIRRASWLVPTPQAYVAAVLLGAGQGRPLRTPYPSHALVAWILGHLPVPTSWLVRQNGILHADIRRRALRKAERERKTK